MPSEWRRKSRRIGPRLVEPGTALSTRILPFDITPAPLPKEVYHAPVTPTVWTPSRKLLGNLVPAILWMPPMAIGLAMIVRGGSFGGAVPTLGENFIAGLAWLVGGTVVGWLATNFFGLYQNRRMRAQVERIMKAKGEDLPESKWFVGFATPKYSSLVDPHEDVGFLCVYPDRLRFVSETREVEFERKNVLSVRHRPNIHTWIGLGRWVSVEGAVAGKPVRFLIEPRERQTLLGNLRVGSHLRRALTVWAQKG